MLSILYGVICICNLDTRLKLCDLKANGKKKNSLISQSTGISNFWLIYIPLKAHAIKQLKIPVSVFVYLPLTPQLVSLRHFACYFSFFPPVFFLIQLFQECYSYFCYTVAFQSVLQECNISIQMNLGKEEKSCVIQVKGKSSLHFSVCFFSFIYPTRS